MKNYYEILNISKNASQEEIRNGYKKMLRKYPPEKEQEKYKEIREAYDTLKDEKSRKNYDAYFYHEKDIKSLEDKYTEYMEAKNYNEAEKVLKKIRIISPEIAHIKDKLGEVYFFKENYDKSFQIYRELKQKYPNNIDYFIKLGRIFIEKKAFSMARIYFIKAYNFDNSNPNAVSGIVYSYLRENNVDEAIRFLDREIRKDNKLDFEDFFALSKLLECYIMKNDTPNLKNTLEKIKKIAPEDEESKGFISWKLAKFAAELYDREFYEETKEISAICLKLTPNIDIIQELHRRANLFLEADKLIKDEDIENVVKFPVINYIFGEKLDVNVREKALLNIKIYIEDYVGRIVLREEIRKISWKYHLLFNEPLINEFYQKILKLIN